MIFQLNGIISELLPNGVVVDVHGVGYAVEMPLSGLCLLPQVGHEVKLWTFTYVREDCIRLFGFNSGRERLAFEILIGLSGVGPKIALAVLSTLPLPAIVQAVKLEKPQMFESVPGIGKRLAERILVDLKPKLKSLDLVSGIDQMHAMVHQDALTASKTAEAGANTEQSELLRILDDVRSALENLGFKDKATQEVCAKLWAERCEPDFQLVMRLALKMLSGPIVDDVPKPQFASKDQKHLADLDVL